MQLSHRGRPDDAIVGGPREVADRLEELFSAFVCDGFVVGATHVPGGYADFVDFVVHLFHPETRSFYQLERLWDDAPELLPSST